MEHVDIYLFYCLKPQVQVRATPILATAMESTGYTESKQMRAEPTVDSAYLR